MSWSAPIYLENQPPLYFRAATPKEVEQCSIRSFADWGGKLQVEAYLKISNAASNSEFLKHGQRFWVLSSVEHRDADDDVPVDPDTIFAACDTQEKPALFKFKGMDGLEETTCFGIASVYAHPGKRKMGLASVMLRKLKEWMDEQAGRGAKLSVLYSGIGKEFYSARGWRTMPSFEINFPVRSQVENASGYSPIKSESELRDLCERDIKQIKSKIETASLADEDEALVTLLPTQEQLSLQIMCGKLSAGYITGGSVPEVIGAKVGQDTWGVWEHSLGGVTTSLILLRIVKPSDPCKQEYRSGVVSKLRTLLLAAEAEARAWGLKNINIWSPDDELLQAAKTISGWEDVEVTSRPVDKIPHLRWAPTVDKDGGLARKTKWEPCEKYSWC